MRWPDRALVLRVLTPRFRAQVNIIGLLDATA